MKLIINLLGILVAFFSIQIPLYAETIPEFLSIKDYLLEKVTVYTYSNKDQRGTFTYNSEGNLLVVLYEVYSDNQWVNSYRRTMTYNQSGENTEKLEENWDSTGWQGKYHYFYRYNSNKKIIFDSTIYFINGKWENFEKKTYVYLVQDKLTRTLIQTWDTQNLQWVNDLQYYDSYDERGNLLESIFQKWTDRWVDNSKHTSTYDFDNNKLTYLTELWNGVVWQEDSRFTYNYSNNLKISELYERRQNQIWTPIRRDIFVYDANRNLVSDLVLRFSAGKWDSTARYSYQYDNSGNMTSDILETWFQMNSQWTFSTKGQYTYNYDNLLLIGLRFKWSNTDSSWKQFDGLVNFKDAKYSYTYNGYRVETGYINFQDAADISNQPSALRIYPNPAATFAYIETNVAQDSPVSLEIKNVLGIRVIEIFRDRYLDKGKHEFPVILENLPSGIYFAVCRTGSKSYTAKFIIGKK